MAMSLDASDNVRVSRSIVSQAGKFYDIIEYALITYSLVNASDSDVTISSSDGVLFKVHRAILTAHSEVFPDGTFPTNDEIVTLSEQSSTLDRLFHYMYRKVQPEVTELPFKDLSMLAEAAEKA